MLLPSRRASNLLTGVLLVGSFFITSLSNLSESLEPVAKFSPLTYYQGGEAIHGLNLTWLAALLGFACLFLLLAWWRFQARDIRVSGEGSWPFADRIRARRLNAKLRNTG